MYFKRLEIFGFKSFADKTVLNFEPGITAIVGPNGCGKSNVFDAVRWVLGEQSVKQLRGGEMQDVIFNGTDTKLALGFAEVSVVFDNTSRVLPITEDEVQVTRRLYRSGESEYLINKRESRLKDITELFMGTGVGAEAYSLVPQGRVDLVVSARAEDRRIIFDEAAGITKYKARKREAQSKLKETDDNLLRLNDIVTEVKRQIAAVERQAQKAQRYREEFEKLKRLEQALAQLQVTALRHEREGLRAALAEVQAREAAIMAGLDEQRGVAEREAAALEQLELQVRDVREQDLRAEGQMELVNRQIGFNGERLAHIDQNEERIARQKDALARKSGAHLDRMAELDRLTAEHGAAAQAAAAALEAVRAILAGATEAIREGQRALAGDEERLLSLASRQSELRDAAAQAMKHIEGALVRRRRLDTEEQRTRAEKEAVDRRLAGVAQGITDVRARRDQLSADLAREQDHLSRRNEELAAVAAAIDGLEKKGLFLNSQKEFIEKLQVQYQDMPDPVIDGRFISAAAPVLGQSGFIGKIREVIPVDGERNGRLREQLSRVGGGHLYEIVCETKFIELDPGALAAQIAAIEEELRHLRAERETRAASIAEQSQRIERLRGDIHREERQLSVHEAQQGDIVAEAAKLSAELETVAREMAEADKALAGGRADEASVRDALREIDEESVQIREGLAGRQEELARRRREREEAAVSAAQREADVAAQQERERAQNAERDRLSRERDGFLDEISRLDLEVASFGDRRQQLRGEVEALSVELEQLKGAREALRTTLAGYEAQEQEVSRALSTLRARISIMEKDLADGRDLVHERNMRLQQVDFQEQAVRERLSQKYGVDLEAPVAENEGAAPLPETQEQLQQEIQTLAKRCEAFGGVNLMAIEEFEELKNRYQFLTRQQADLLTAKDALEQTIRKINKTTRQLFVDTFIKVNEQFRTYFRLLFNGGEAQLVLLDPENALESGIEIVARPPGKKLQTISLLSGGEKTMTAIALIFSVFRVNPSPFCVLDEIDAALDEANVDRFAGALKEFAKIAQFIIITHNKKTIANADVMYGITMQQTGVSRVVSVKFADRAAATAEAPLAQPAVSLPPPAVPLPDPEPPAGSSLSPADRQESGEPEPAFAGV